MLNKNSDSHALIMAQIQDVENCLVAFESFMRAATTPGTPIATLRSLRESVGAAENEADVSLRAMIDSLSEGSYLPSTREDLIAIATSCDNIANKCESIADLVVIFKFVFPPEFAKDCEAIFEITKKQFALLEHSISMLFSKLNVLQKDASILDEIRSLESEIDKIEFKVDEEIFNGDLDPLAKMQFFDIVKYLCDVSDIIEDIADKIQIMLIASKA